jgi:hypothetical protein
LPTSTHPLGEAAAFVPDSSAAWRRLLTALAIGTVGSVGVWSAVVALPKVQADFEATRGAVSLAHTMAMMGFGIGGVITGRLTDRFGIVPAMAMGVLMLLIGYVGAGLASKLWLFTAMNFVIGLGSSATFAPLMAEAFALVRPCSATARPSPRDRLDGFVDGANVFSSKAKGSDESSAARLNQLLALRSRSAAGKRAPSVITAFSIATAGRSALRTSSDEDRSVPNIGP